MSEGGGEGCTVPHRVPHRASPCASPCLTVEKRYSGNRLRASKLS